MRCFEHGDKIPLKTWLNFQWSTIWNCATIRSCSMCILRHMYIDVLTTHVYTASIEAAIRFLCRSCACNSNSVLMFNWPKQSDTSKAIEILFAIACDGTRQRHRTRKRVREQNSTNHKYKHQAKCIAHSTHISVQSYQNTEITHRNHCFIYLAKRNWSTF